MKMMVVVNEKIKNMFFRNKNDYLFIYEYVIFVYIHYYLYNLYKYPFYFISYMDEFSNNHVDSLCIKFFNYICVTLFFF